MYVRDIPKKPREISRSEYVEIIFELGRINRHTYSTIVGSVRLGDYFINFREEREIYRGLSEKEKEEVKIKKKEVRKEREENGIEDNMGIKMIVVNKILENRSSKTIMDELVEQIYSVELAHVVTVIGAKYNEEFGRGYRTIRKAAGEVENCYVNKMEIEIIKIIGFTYKMWTFVNIIEEIMGNDKIGGVFGHIFKDICKNKKVLDMKPVTIVMGIYMVGGKDRLRATESYRFGRFKEIVEKMGKEYEVKIEDILKTYIKLKT